MKTQLSLLFLVSVPMVLSLFSQTTPPTVAFTSPPGLQRGTTVSVVIEGTDLTGAKAIVFSEPGLSGKILSVHEAPKKSETSDAKPTGGVKPYFDEPPRLEAKVEISAEEWTATGVHFYRIVTPHGSSTPGKIEVSSFRETVEHEPNDGSGEAQHIDLPVTINGTIQRAGDQDEFSFQAKKSQEIVFILNAAGLGSSLDPKVEVFNLQNRSVACNLKETDHAAFGYKVSEDGTFTVRITDFLKSGGPRHFYRLSVGQFPFLKGRYPLGLMTGTASSFKVWGFNLGETRTVSPEPFGIAAGKVMDTGFIGVASPWGETVNRLPIAIGRYQELEETGGNDSINSAQVLTIPVTLNGRVPQSSSGAAIPRYFQFNARQGETVILETAANRLGSPIDTVIEVLDSKGNIVPRVTARPVWKGQITLFDRDSKSPGLRITGSQSLELDDYMVCGNEVLRVVKMVNGPDEDVIFNNFGGQRVAEEETTPEAHALDDWIYKVELHRAGSQFPPNGMPLFQFYYRNDDGGPGFGKDSHLSFKAPLDGVYFAKVSDVRDKGGEDYTFRLTIREPNPDFQLTAVPKNPNIPFGSKVPVEVTALRTEGFTGSIDVEFDGLPEGVSATRGTIPPGEKSVTLVLEAKPETSQEIPWARYRIIGKAQIGNQIVARVADGGDLLKLVSFMPNPDIKVAVKNDKIRLYPGGTTKVTVTVERFNGFAGRVPFKIQDLPYGVRVTDVGLNGVMIAERENELTFTLECRPYVKPTKRNIYVVGQVEALVNTEHPSAAIPLEVVGVEKASR